MQEDRWDQELLGQAAPNPIRLVIKHFGEEV